MLSRVDVNLDCRDVDAQAAFWVAALGYSPAGAAGQYRALGPPDGVHGPKLILQQVPEPPPSAKIRMHLDLIVGDDIEGEVARLEELGAVRRSKRIDEAETAWIVMADPEGNEFCVCVT